MFELDARRRLISSCRAPGLAARPIWLGAALLLALSLSAVPKAAHAEPPPAAPSGKPKAKDEKRTFIAEVTVLHATNAKKGIDPSIGSMPELAKPPFSSYDSYELLNRQRLTLDKQTAQTLTLPNGRTLETRLVEVLSPETVRLSASINQPNGKEFLPLLEVKAKLNQSFIVAGQSYTKGNVKGILVLVIRLVK